MILPDLPSEDNTDPHEGERRKSDSHRLIETYRDRLVLRGRRALLTHLLRNGTGTIDDVRDCVPAPPEVNPKAFGAVPGPLARKGIIKANGSQKTKRAIGHARPVTVWKLENDVAAVAWLRDHPVVEPPQNPGDGSAV